MAVAFAGCARGPAVAPIDGEGVAAPAPAKHVVRKGDTLYAIAWRYGLDYRDLARWNSIPPPYVIYPGQAIATRPPPSRPPPARAATPARKREGSAGSAPRASAGGAVDHRRAAPRRTVVPPGGWKWPTQGRVVRRFGQGGNRGLDIAGRRGQIVKAAADGRVVYSGSGLGGYGKLIIIKHDKHFLTAYAHNDQVLVVEGEGVKGGDPVARMGDTGTDQVKLHFEVRRDGKPVDPTHYLPRPRR